ncbi:MAG TPA: hypothetical protein VFX92_04690 [Candidatus Krumholzibacteria bacterium]|nr:hypothetical protein [Candidatus Krumholzibacteria bacterium]
MAAMNTRPHMVLSWAAIAVLTASVAVCAFAATPRFTESVVVRGGFGPAPEQFGRTGIETSQKTTRLVMCFAASPNYIAIHDRVKRDVKVFTPTGVFDKSIRLVLTPDAKADTVRARDIAIDGETLYVLVDDLPDGSKDIPASMRLATFSIATGDCKAVRRLDTSSLQPMDGKKSARGADAFVLHSDDGHLWLIDSIRQMGFELLFPSGSVAELGKHPVFGWGGANHRVRTDDNVSSINLLDGKGQLQRRLAESGVMVTASGTGSAFAVLQYIPIDDKLDWGITIFDATGDRLGMAPRPTRSWRPFRAPVMERKYELVETAAGPELYELYANADGVRVVRWAR